MIKKTNKKGFTLAELLIVVAIIAVLTAIAVPLFVGALENADKRVEEANKRAVRVVAVDKILLDDTLLYKTAATKTLYGYWEVEALVGASGDVTKITIAGKDGTAPAASTEVCTKLTTDNVSTDACKVGGKEGTQGEVGGYYIKIFITEVKPA